MAARLKNENISVRILEHFTRLIYRQSSFCPDFSKYAMLSEHVATEKFNLFYLSYATGTDNKSLFLNPDNDDFYLTV